MRVYVGPVRSRHVTRVAIVALLAGLSAGCSSDTLRFADNPFTNPFRGKGDPVDTASVPSSPVSPVRRQALAPIQPVAAQPLAPIGSVAAQPVATMPAMPSPEPVVQSSLVANPALATGSVHAAKAAGVFKTARGSWVGDGGSVVTASAGDTVQTLSSRYGVPAGALMAVNGFNSPTLTPGQQVTIPVFTMGQVAEPAADVVKPVRSAVSEAAKPVAAEAKTIKTAAADLKPVRVIELKAGRAPASEAAKAETIKAEIAKAETVKVEPATAEATKVVERATTPDGYHVVKPGETLTAIAVAYGSTRPKLAQLNGIDEWTSVRIGQKLKVPAAAKVVQAKADKPAKEAVVAAADKAPVKPVVPVKTAAAVKHDAKQEAKLEVKPVKTQAVAKAEPKETIAATPSPKAVASKPAVEEPVATASTPEKTVTADASATDAQPAARTGPAFRWPVKGRVINAYGQSSDGIAISVPEGTAVKAAENGVVAYAGNELKGYGNLVLIRHADGWVTAYAHAKDLNVKRGDTVQRGQVIATAGQTGNVNAPQLLFELRKGATPVDPRLYLSGT